MGLEVVSGENVSSSFEGIEVQKRDAEMLLYLNEMGWASAEVLSLRFYCDEISKWSEPRFKTARRRLWKLKNSGFLRSFRIGRSEAYYVSTKKSINLLEFYYPSMPHLKAIQHISFNLNEHFKRVHYSRLALEFAGKSFGWRSERRLKMSDIPMQQEAFKGNHQPYLPDGIFLNETQEKVVFEYENAQKSLKQMKKKLEQIDRILRAFSARYQKVLIVCTSATQVANYSELLKGREKYEILEFSKLLKLARMDHVWKN